jgi:type III restriction enzyme
MKRYIPELKSKEEFLYGENWLNINNLTLRVEAPLEFTESDLNSKDKLNIVLSYLSDIETKIIKGYSSERVVTNLLVIRLKTILLIIENVFQNTTHRRGTVVKLLSHVKC